MSYRNQLAKNLFNTAPKVARKIIAITPNPVLKKAMETAFNAVFAESISNGELAFFNNKTLKIAVTDIDFSFYLKESDNQLKVSFIDCTPDLTFSGSGDNFLLLASQEVDPDTLFFQRKLKISGDTELGLEIKNFLSSIDPAELYPPQVFALLKKASDFLVEAQEKH